MKPTNSILRIIATALTGIIMVSLLVVGCLFFVVGKTYGDIHPIFTAHKVAGYILGVVFILWAVINGILLIFDIKSIKSPRSHIPLGVLQLIFGGVIPGILILCSGGQSK